VEQVVGVAFERFAEIGMSDRHHAPRPEPYDAVSDKHAVHRSGALRALALRLVTPVRADRYSLRCG
jgi:hypothetical protein